ncbi:MAG: OmpA family protein, partial [Frankia sp.]
MSSPMVHRPRSPRYGAFALALVLAWALLALLALGLRRGPIQHDLSRRAASAAASAAAGKASDVRVTYRGRDATLHGSFADPAALRRARTAVAGVDGTRSVSVGTDTRVTASQITAAGNPTVRPAPAGPAPSATSAARVSAAPAGAAAGSAGVASSRPAGAGPGGPAAAAG